MDCVNLKPCNSIVYSLVNPQSTSFPPSKPGQVSKFPEEAQMLISFENKMVYQFLSYMVIGPPQVHLLII